MPELETEASDVGALLSIASGLWLLDAICETFRSRLDPGGADPPDCWAFNPVPLESSSRWFAVTATFEVAFPDETGTTGLIAAGVGL